jgi:MFS family permease
MKARAGLAVLFMTVFVDHLGFGIVIPVLPVYADKLGASAAFVGMLFGVYSAMQIAVSPHWGRLSDRIGRRPVIVCASSGTAIGFILLGLGTHLHSLLLARAFLGACGVGLSTAQAWVADTTPPETRGKAMALIGAAAGLGFTFGPALSGFGIMLVGLRFPFFFAAGFAASSAVAAALFLTEPQVIRERSYRRRILDAFAVPALVPCLLVGFVLTSAFSMIEATFALFTTKVLGFAASENAYFFVFIGASAAVVQAFGTRSLVGRVSERRLVGTGLAVLGIGASLMPTVHGALRLLVPVFLMAAGFGLATPSLTAWTSKNAPGDRQGEMLGVFQSTSAMARVVGPSVGGFLFDHAGRGSSFMFAATLLATAAALTIREPRSASA